MAYTRVNWEDLPSTNTPINATNLNKMDEGIYESQGTILFDGSINELGTYNLTDNVNNYNYIEVFAGRGIDYGGNSVKSRRAQESAKLPLIYVSNNANEVIIHLLKFSWAGTTFTYESNTNIDIQNGNMPEISNNTTNLANDKIYKIIGWKIR